MSRKCSSILWSISKEELEKIIVDSTSISQVLRCFSLENKGHNFRTLKKILLEYNIDFTHISLNANKNRNANLKNEPIPLEKILISNSKYNRFHLKKRLIKAGIIKNVCALCNLEPFWNGQELHLQLDHINGVPDDNRLDNLRLLCPNCHSQTDSFAGKKRIVTNQKLRNQPRLSTRKVIRPSKEELIELLKIMSFVRIGKKFGVTDNAVRKWKKSYNI